LINPWGLISDYWLCSSVNAGRMMVVGLKLSDAMSVLMYLKIDEGRVMAV
jgi:hypothetical protein